MIGFERKLVKTIFLPQFDDWRRKARALLAREVPPDRVLWQPDGMPQPLLPGELEIEERETEEVTSDDLRAAVPASFVELARTVSFHRDGARWDLLYRLLWRLARENRELLRIAADPDVSRFFELEKAVRRDAHKAKAFVRFCKTSVGGEERYVAWHRPEHPILRFVAPFFARRFNVLHWSILTPEESAHWDGRRLTFGEGVPRSAAPKEDELEELWRRYYSSVFKPSRVKVKARRAELPKRHRATLPEARVIHDLVRERPGRLHRLLEHEPPSARAFLPEPDAGWTELAAAAAGCRGCPLAVAGTRTVFGEGPLDAAIALVGEQPGDEEDRSGRPFVGPAGRLLDRALAESGLPREALYLTNAVKHFKHKETPQRRLHQRPGATEIVACKPWLERELSLVRPRVVVCLGVTAATSVVGRVVRLQDMRGRFFPSAFAAETLVTIHPSAILRAPDEAKREEEYRRFVEDLRTVREKAGKL